MNKQTKTKTKLPEGEKFLKSENCKNNHSSPLTNLSWCDLGSKSNLPKLHGMCFNPKRKCQKHTKFKPKDFQLEGAGFKNTMKKIVKGSENAWRNSMFKPAVNTLGPVIGMAIATKSKNPQVGQVATNLLKSISGR